MKFTVYLAQYIYLKQVCNSLEARSIGAEADMGAIGI